MLWHEPQNLDAGVFYCFCCILKTCISASALPIASCCLTGGRAPLSPASHPYDWEGWSAWLGAGTDPRVVCRSRCRCRLTGPGVCASLLRGGSQTWLSWVGMFPMNSVMSFRFAHACHYMTWPA